MTHSLRNASRLGLLLAALLPACQTMEPDWEVAPRTKLVLLGTGTPNAHPDRSGPALAVVVDGVAYLVDAGPGIVRRAAAAARAGVAGLEPPELERVFLTHLHSDHTLGLPDLLYTPWTLGREVPLSVYGPPGSAALCQHLERAYQSDVRLRIDGLEPANTTGHRVEVHEIEAGGLVYEDERVKVTAIPVEHGSWEHAFGYRFDTPDRTVVVSGDARPTPALVEAARGVDLLVHEVYSYARYQEREAAWKRYHASFHTSTLELAAIAAEAQPKLLVLSHQLFWGDGPEDLLAEIASAYEGAVVSGNDLDVF